MERAPFLSEDLGAALVDTSLFTVLLVDSEFSSNDSCYLLPSGPLRGGDLDESIVII